MSSLVNKPHELEIQKQMLEYATKIYKDNNDSTFFYSDKKTDLQVGIYLTDRICIAFRGTESIKDDMYDLNITKRRISINNIRVHGGFYNQLIGSEIYDDFRSKVLSLISEHPTYEIFITGHSLGGALATLFGYILSDIIKSNINVISFASPKIGNKQWKLAFNNKINLKHTRIVISSDLIPCFPLINYYHCGNLVKLNNSKFFLSIDNHYTKVYQKYLK